MVNPNGNTSKYGQTINKVNPLGPVPTVAGREGVYPSINPATGLPFKQGPGVDEDGRGRVAETLHPDELRRMQGERGSVTKNENLERLATEVAGMSTVFEEANKAREEQRRIMDEMHEDVLLRVQSTRDYMGQEVKRLEQTLQSFIAKFEFELRQLRNELMTKLNTKISQVRWEIAKVNLRIDEIQVKLNSEIWERKEAMKTILVPIQKDVASLVVQLDEEKNLRQANEKQKKKQLEDAVSLLEKTLDVEKFNREQQYMDFKVVAEYERERILKRQYVIEKQMKLNLEAIDQNIKLETGDRIEKQDNIVDNMTNFIKAFQENIREEART